MYYLALFQHADYCVVNSDPLSFGLIYIYIYIYSQHFANRLKQPDQQSAMIKTSELAVQENIFPDV